MLKNYFKIAIAVLKRRKFFTFISLFGISFTLTILIVATAFVDNVTSANYPELNRDRSLYINFLQQRNSKYGYTQNGPASYYYMDQYVNKLKTPESIGISSLFVPVNTYVNNKKLVVNIKYTNEAYWHVMQYQYIEGKPYTQQQIDNAERVAVISDDLKKDYFGDIPNVVGKYIEADNVQYRITGVVKSVPVTMAISYADLYAPYTVSKTDYRTKGLSGNYSAILLARSKAELPKIKEEYAGIVAKIKPEQKDFDQFISYADSYVTSFTRQMAGDPTNSSGLNILITAASAFILFFMLLPTLNLININISRIMERSSEIGVRKAFGASSKTLVWQFIVENIILTFFGAVIGIVLSFIILQVINNSELITNMHLSINLTVLLYSLIACLFFGLLSGVYPAWRMSRLEVVTALKAQ
ncbi:FtsX-like permease family protein [Panacibacter ginsenosidivorans]|uniref:FtsX-like permease family protein n=1 Tax=Panacibacter ginsenosidivorans TaxID=1813871 RepID=A0A5B8VD89_9BACT|nr:ABC transporter permease [Panacibacter ginsenosidivorans]QEC68931.1 FtsX-like permease family protein [Panacibacter ginsenosidivorans]